MAERWIDQADGLRRLLSEVPLQFVTLTSAHAEAGRPWAVLNLAAALRLAGVGVLVVDAAAGHPGGLTRAAAQGYQLLDVLLGRCALEAAILPGPEGIPVLPARSGVRGLGEPGFAAHGFADRLHALPGGIEVLLVNLPADESGTQIPGGLLEHEVVVTARPERDSITSTYRLLKRLVALGDKREFRLLVTGARNAGEAKRVHRNLAEALERWLGARIELLGVMPADNSLRLAASQGRILVAAEPATQAATNFRRMADSLIRLRGHARARSRAETPVFSWADAVGLATPSLRG
jgi:flagellar biosynthesis protein FlhG